MNDLDLVEHVRGLGGNLWVEGDTTHPVDLGWSAWIKGSLATGEVPGDHYGILRAPHAAVLVALLEHPLGPDGSDRAP
jgi:thioesterase domain-containing protein